MQFFITYDADGEEATLEYFAELEEESQIFTG